MDRSEIKEQKISLSIFGVTMIYNENNKLIDKYFSTIKQWITSIKAETMAFFTALLMIPPGKKCTELLEDQTLDVKIVKVNAHSDNVLHNQVDKEIKEKEEENTFSTNKWIEKQKRMKIQRLIEEIPTIEQLKKSSYDLYRGFKCVICNKKKEEFIHVWTCYNRKKMKFIIKECIDKLRMFLIEKGVKNITTEEIINLDVFGNRFTNEKFNFVDLIKGIFPSQLYEFILETIKQVWEPRCELLAQLEKNYEITKQDKRKPDSLFLEEKQEEITNRPNCFVRRH
ncbi:hypothetical protein C1646_763951 [Rhizophagus diaphanus]|nr:hypothetical protein C1646_763951 [Rhizophagus diaphanus] [Rhizophagus sp. MUCL 43196]